MYKLDIFQIFQDKYTWLLLHSQFPLNGRLLTSCSVATTTRVNACCLLMCVSCYKMDHITNALIEIPLITSYMQCKKKRRKKCSRDPLLTTKTGSENKYIYTQSIIDAEFVKVGQSGGQTTT